MMMSQALAQSSNYSNWEISASNLTNGKLVMIAGETKTITYSVTVVKNPSFITFNFNLQRQPASSASCGCTAISGQNNITPSDFPTGQNTITKQYTASVTAAAGSSLTGSTLRNGDRIILAIATSSGPYSPNKSFVVTVLAPPVANNTISNSGSSSFNNSGDPSILNGSTPTGGNGTYGYQWQSSTTSAASGFANIVGAAGKNFDPPTISQTTYYRRVVTSGTGASSTSNVVQVTIVQVAPIGATFNNPIDIGNLGLCTNYGHAVDVLPGSGYGNEFGNEFDDVFYKFNLTGAYDLSLLNCKPDGVSGALYLLDAFGANVPGINGQSCDVGGETIYSLQPGLYYVVSESTASWLTYLHMQIYIWGPSCRMAAPKIKGLKSSSAQASTEAQLEKLNQPQPESTRVPVNGIYPNPASHYVSLNLQQDGPAAIRIVNTNGITVKETIVEKSAELNISDLPAGLYLVKIIQQNKVRREKMLIER